MAVPILMVPGPGNRLFNIFGMNGPKKVSFSTIPIPFGIVFDGGLDFDGPRARKRTFFACLVQLLRVMGQLTRDILNFLNVD